MQAAALPPPSLLRSLTFWGGMVVLLFLGSVWLDSKYQSTMFMVEVPGGSGLRFGASRAELWINCRSSGGDEPFFLRYNTQSMSNKSYLWPPTYFPADPVQWDSTSFSEWRFSIALWLVILIHLVLWGILLYLRRRRLKRAATPSS